MKYVVVYGTWILLILLLSLITSSIVEKLNPLITSAIIILASCTIISLLNQTVQTSYTKYVVISLVGLIVICIANLIVFECHWSKIIVLKCAAAIVVCCIIVSTAVGSDSVPILRYVSVFAIGLLLIIIVSYFTGYNKENMHILLSSSGLIISCCVMVNILLSSINLSSIKYYLVFLIGFILFFLIYFIVSLCRADTVIAFVSLGIILVVCGLTDLIIAALEIYYMRFVAVAVAGVLLIIIISFGTGCNSENMHILISSSGLVICCCVIASFFLSTMSIISMKYYLVFLIGITLFFLIYVIVSLCRAEEGIAFAFLLIILVICGLIDLIIAALEIYYMRFISVAVIAFFIFIILLAGTECNPKKKHTVISGLGLLLCICYFICWWLGANSIMYNLYFVILAACTLFFFTIYFFVTLCSDHLLSVKICAGIIYTLCFILEAILLCIEFEVVIYILIYLAGLIVAIFIIGMCDYLRENIEHGFELIIFIIAGCSWLCVYLGGRDIFLIKFILTFSIIGVVLCVCRCLSYCESH